MTSRGNFNVKQTLEFLISNKNIWTLTVLILLFLKKYGISLRDIYLSGIEMKPLDNVYIFSPHTYIFGETYSAFRITITCDNFKNKAYLNPYLSLFVL